MLIFGLQQLLPGDPAMILAGEERDPNGHRATCARSCTSTSRCRCATCYWVGGVLHGDLGESLRIQQPVLELIAEKLPVTLELALHGDASSRS